MKNANAAGRTFFDGTPLLELVEEISFHNLVIETING
jgi:hypothetical protein